MLIEHNKSVDDLTFASIFNSTRVRVTSNWIRARVNDPFFEDEAASAIFIGARNDDIVVQKNKIKSASGNGIDVSNTGEPGTGPAPPTNVVVRKNKVAHAQLSGIAVSATGAGEYQVLANRSRNNALNGIHFAPGTNGGTVTGNTALGNGGFDCRDESSRCNTWTGNVGVTAEPLTALCTAPTLDSGTTRPRRRRQGQEKQEAQEAPQEDEEAEEAPPPGPVRVHAPLALLT